MDISAWLEVLTASIQSPFLIAFIICFFFTGIPGPMNVVVVEQTLEKGVPAGAGIALANVFGCLIALLIAALPFLFGIHAVTNWLQANATLAGSVLALAMLGVGVMMIRAPDGPQQAQPPKVGYVIWAFVYSALQPGNVLINTAIITTLMSYELLNRPTDIIPMFAGYFLATGIVWLVYVLLARYVRVELNSGTMHRLKNIMGGLISFFALAALVSLFAF